MKTYIIASLIVGLLSGGVFAIDNDDNITTTESDNTTITETTTSAITTTTPAITTTTLITTETPITTTSVSTTPVTSTVPPTTPVPSPPDVKDPEEGSWAVVENNVTCIKLDAAIQFQFSYEQVNEKFVKTRLNVPKNASVDEYSSCDEHIISLTFDNTTFALKFVEEKGKVMAKLATITYLLDNETFPGAKNMGEQYSEFADNLTLFEVTKGKSYLCKSKKSEIDFNGNTTGSLAKPQVEAFRNSTSSKFSDSEECSADDDKINDIVPIAVGCALAALVIIVLIAYLVGRRRTRQRGYQSV